MWTVFKVSWKIKCHLTCAENSYIVAMSHNIYFELTVSRKAFLSWWQWEKLGRKLALYWCSLMQLHSPFPLQVITLGDIKLHCFKPKCLNVRRGRQIMLHDNSITNPIWLSYSFNAGQYINPGQEKKVYFGINLGHHYFKSKLHYLSKAVTVFFL